MASYTSQIESLFDELTLTYLKATTMKYINMEMFKADFVQATIKVIDEASMGVVDEEGSEEDIEDVVSELVCDIPFGFDSSDAMHETDFDAQRDIEKFIMEILEKTE